MTVEGSRRDQGAAARLHMAFGWTALLLFAVMGLTLEALHAFKLSGYLDADNSTRRLMWTLAHAHGSLLGLVNVAFSLTLSRVAMSSAATTAASAALRGATVLMPAGFFLGGVWVYGGDPGIGVLLVPVGGVALLVALGVVAKATVTR